MTTESGRHSHPSNPTTDPLLNTGPDAEPHRKSAGTLGTTLPGTGYAPVDAGGDPFLGRELSSYRISDKIGQGGMGVVYLGQHTMIGRKAAVKVLKTELCKDPDVVERFYQEGRAVGQLAHENIIDVYDFGKTEDGQVYFIMELLEGETLTGRIKRGPLPFVEAYAIILQIAEALRAAHDKGIVHRDIKPDNIFLIPKAGGPPKVKVLDFGLAKLAGPNTSQHERLTQNGSIMGTPHYMSPQQIDGANVDGRADLYALGAVIYEMFVGAPPFQGTTIGELLKGHLFVPPPPLRADPSLQVPGMMERVVARALEKQVEARYSSAQELIEAVKAAAKDTTLVPAPGFVVKRPTKPWVWAALGGGVATAAAAIFLWLNPEPPEVIAPTSAPISSAPTVQKVDSKELRGQALNVLRAALKEREAELRAGGAKGVGKIQDKGSLQELLALLQDPESSVQKTAALALAELNDERAVSPLQELRAKTEDRAFALAIDRALFRLGSEEAEAKLLKTLTDKEAEVRLEAALSLSAQGVYDAEKPLKAALTSTDEALQKRKPEVLNSLLRLGDEGAEASLLALLEDPSESTRLAAAEILANVGDERGRAAAQRSLDDPSSPYRVSAARVMVLLGDYSQNQLFSSALQAPDASLQQEGIEGLALMGEQSALPELSAFLAPEKQPLVRIAASIAILEIVGLSAELLAQNSQEALSTALASNDAKLRAKAASALGSADFAGALPLLQKAAQDQDQGVRKEAVIALGKLGTKEVVADLAQAIQDKDANVAKAAADALSQINGQEAKDALKQAKDGEAAIVAAGELAARGEQDSTNIIDTNAKSKEAKLRAAAMKAAGKAKREDVLLKGLKDKDANVRFEAAKALAQQGKSEGQAILEENAKNKDEATALEAKNALASLGALPASEGSFFWPTRADDDVKKKIIANAKSYDAINSKRLLSRALHDSNPDVQLAAVNAIGALEVKDAEAAKKLYRAAIREKDPSVKAAAKAALARLEQQGPKQPEVIEAANPSATPSLSAPSEAEQKSQEYQLQMSLAGTAISTGHYADAVTRLKKAQEIKSEIRVFFELGEAYRKWGDQSNKDPKQQVNRWKLAKSNYERFIKGGGKGTNLEKAKRAIADLEFNLSSANNK